MIYSDLLNLYFPRAAAYRKENSPHIVRETRTAFQHFPYSERHIQCLWADARLRPQSLRTSTGEPVHIEHPGHWNLEAGPDFLHAVLRIGTEQRRVSGDLEIHIHPAAWKQHGHHTDPRYARVRFHVVHFCGIEIPGLIQIPLQELLSANPHFSYETIDTTAYPYSMPTGYFPFKALPFEQKIERLEQAGEERLRLKVERFSCAMQKKEPNQLLWEELMAALGYKNNKVPFRKIASILPLEHILALAGTPYQAYALLLGLSGLLPAQPNPTWDGETRKFIRSLWDFWWKQRADLTEQALQPQDWNLAGIRPANHPVRRLMAAAYYSFQLPEPQLTRTAPNFWTTHISWKTPCSPTALVGQPRANAMITNIMVPWKIATERAVPPLEKLPVEPINSIIRQTAYTLFGPDHSPNIYRSALARQGLIQIFHDTLITHKMDTLR